MGVISGADPTLIDPTLMPNAVADELAIWVLRDEPRVSAAIKLGAVLYLWDAVARVDRQRDIHALMMKHFDESMATKVVQVLRANRAI